MAKYSKKAQDKIEKVMHEFKEGELESGSGDKVKNRKQAVAIALSEARESGAKVPPKKKSTSSARKTSARSKSGSGRKSRPSATKSEPSGSKSKATSKKSTTAKRKSSSAAS